VVVAVNLILVVVQLADQVAQEQEINQVVLELLVKEMQAAQEFLIIPLTD
jgi:hypothetical protein